MIRRKLIYFRRIRGRPSLRNTSRLKL